MDLELAKKTTLMESDRVIEGQDQPSLETTDVSTSSSTPLTGRIQLWVNQRKLILLGVGVLLLLPAGLTLGLIGLSSKAPDGKAPSSVINVLPVETMRVKPVASYQVSRTYTGEITALRTSELGFEHSGKLMFVAVDKGKRVEAGTPLAFLDTSSLKASRLELLAQRSQALARLAELKAGSRNEVVAAGRASVRNINAQMELARTKFDRRKGLYAQGAISREQLDEVAFESRALAARLDEAKSNLDELLAGTRHEQILAQAAEVEKLNASLANLEIDIAKSTIKAPFAGTVSKRLIDEGTVVSAGQPILRLVEDGKVEVEVGVPVSANAILKPGSMQNVRVGQKTYKARVLSLLPELDSSTRTLTVILTLDDSVAAEVAPGQIARLDLVETIPSSGYWLPTTALVKANRGLWSCYVLAEDEKGQHRGATTALSSLSTTDSTFRVERRDVEILHTDSERVLVRGTIQPGDQAIIKGTQRIVPGQLVRPAQI